MSVLATEDFTGLAAAMPNPPWLQKIVTGGGASFGRDGSGAGGTGSAGTDAVVTRNDISPPADQYSLAKLTAAGFKYVIVRASADATASTIDHYTLLTNGGSGTCYIAKWNNGVETIIQSLGVATAVGDVIRLEITGSSPATLKAFLQTGGVGLFVQMGPTATDSDFTSGSFGLGSDTVGAMDDWEGGDFVVVATQIKSRGRGVMQQRIA